MAHRKAKRWINQSDEFVVFTSEKKGDNIIYRTIISSDEAWELLLNLAIKEYPIRETLRNVLNTADEYRKNNNNED